MLNKIKKFYNNMSIATKAALWFVFCNIMQKGISTITVPLFTRLLTTAEYGTYSLYISWFNILTIVTSLNLYYGVFNNALNRIRDKCERDKYVSSITQHFDLTEHVCIKGNCCITGLLSACIRNCRTPTTRISSGWQSARTPWNLM